MSYYLNVSFLKVIYHCLLKSDLNTHFDYYSRILDSCNQA